MAGRKTVGWVAGGMTAGAWLWLGLFFHPFPPAIDVRPHEGAGEILAREAFLKKVNQAALQFAADHDNMLPRMEGLPVQRRLIRLDLLFSIPGL